jgi:two-component system response regulator FixJ
VTAQQTVFLVEDDERMRAAIELLLRTEGFEVQSYPDAEAFLASETCLQSICLLTDIRLPGMDGLDLHRHLLSVGAAPATVMITGHGDIPLAVSALKEGVLDFIEKPFHPPVLVESMKEASRRALATRDHAMKMAEFKVRLKTLTSREAEVLDLLAEGESSKAIASRLGISVRTAEHYRANIMEKLEVPSTSRLISMMSSMQAHRTVGALSRGAERRWLSGR